MCATLAYATTRLRSVDRSKAHVATTDAAAATDAISGAHASAPAKGSQNRKSPYPPSFSNRLASSILPSVGASTCATVPHSCIGALGSLPLEWPNECAKQPGNIGAGMLILFVLIGVVGISLQPQMADIRVRMQLLAFPLVPHETDFKADKPHLEHELNTG